MTRRMADSVTPKNCPPGFPLYLGYVDGRWPSYYGLVKLYPDAIHVPCTVFAKDNIGTVLDVETGDATPAQAPWWVAKRRIAGVHPTVYCSASVWPAVRQAFQRTSIGEPEYLIASYSKPPDPTIPKGAIGHQFIDHGPYDESVVADYWPGVDIAPPIPDPPVVTPFPEDRMKRIDVSVPRLDPTGHGYTDLPGVPAGTVISVRVNTADYKPAPASWGDQDFNGYARIEWSGEVNAPPFTARIWVAG